eukprot:175173_1
MQILQCFLVVLLLQHLHNSLKIHWRSRGLPMTWYVGSAKIFFVSQCVILALLLPFIAYAVSREWILGVTTAVLDCVMLVHYVIVRKRSYHATLDLYRIIENKPNWISSYDPAFDVDKYDIKDAV